MALSDWFQDQQHKARSLQLEVDLLASKGRCASTEAELLAVKERYTSPQELAKKYGAMEVADAQREIAAERLALPESLAMAKLSNPKPCSCASISRASTRRCGGGSSCQTP